MTSWIGFLLAKTTTCDQFCRSYCTASFDNTAISASITSSHIYIVCRATSWPSATAGSRSGSAPIPLWREHLI
ncbi:hypothetical protein BT63DRAFT_106476 [Microthyrium microscopicum]|uniref:Uncharacterized protein n=1 Tax=Microthyrium microscopicum TaxID=703497 RepID=A0A6A6TYU4_9PEZI|nr:hypothetical protein BT63DRAFT_106476 [Microthyrium microscopicum]